MSIFTKIKIGQASSDYSKFDLSHSHLTTMDFSQFVTPFNMECNIGDKIDIDMSCFSRVAPMVFPTFGDVGLRSITAFVPYYTLAEDSDAFISGLKQYSGYTASGRYFYAYDLARIFFGDALVYNAGDAYNDTNTRYAIKCSSNEEDELNRMDFTKVNIPEDKFLVTCQDTTTPGSPQFWRYWYKLTGDGKYLYKVLRQLGYGLPHEFTFNKSGSSITDVYHCFSWANYYLNAYPLLALFKVYADLLLPTSFYQTSALVQILYDVRMKQINGHVGSDGRLDDNLLSRLFDNLFKVYYDSDYFTSAWQSPNQPLNNMNVSVTAGIEKYTDSVAFSSVSQSGYGIQLNIASDAGTTKLGQTQLRFLKAFDDFVRRNNLVGYRDYQAIYSKYGLKPSDMRSHFAQVIDVRNIDLNVGDVTATAQSSDTLLGSYAGKGFMNGKNSIHYECKEFGFLINVCYLYVKPMYYQGLRPQVLRSDCYDFYQPEFDGVGVTPISKLELNLNESPQIFGFTERYNDYRYKLSSITGDFAMDSNMHPWHVGREFIKGSLPASQSLNMLSYATDSAGNCEYDRIFATQNVEGGTAYDHFYMTFNFKVNALRKMKSLSLAQNLGVGDIAMDKNGSL